MNLHSIAAAATSAINPWIEASIQESTGYTTVNYKQVPAYADPVTVRVQRQALQYNDIAQTSGLNIQGEKCAMYLDGNWNGVVRADGTGGDLITLPSGSKWLVVLVLENWSEQDGWTKVCCCRQL
jgi:hypothetical protein